MARPTVLSPAAVATLHREFVAGRSAVEAARAAGVSPATAGRWRAEHLPELFTEAMRTAMHQVPALRSLFVPAVYCRSRKAG